MKYERASDDMVRIYVSRRATGRPVPGWEKAVLFLDGGWVGWTTITEAEAKQAAPGDLVRRRRTPSQPWCDWCGPNTSVAVDREMQAYFAVVDDDAWPHMAIAIRRSQRKTVSEWRAQGARLIAAVSGCRTVSSASLLFRERGTGRRSLLKLIAPDRPTSTAGGPRPHPEK